MNRDLGSTQVGGDVGAQPTLSIGATDYAQRSVLLPLIAALHEKAPGVGIAVRPVETTRVQGQLESGELDMTTLTPDTTYDGLHARDLYDEQYVCAMHKGHSAAKGLNLDQFCDLEHAIVSLGGDAFSGVTDAALAKIGRERRVLLSVPSFLMLLEVLRTSDLIAVLPSRLVHPGDGLAVLDPPLAIPGFRKLVVWHKRTHQHPAHRWIRELLADVSR